MRRPCLTCGIPTPGTYCPTHTRTTAQRGYGAAWQRASKAARAANPWCQYPGCTGPAHSTDHTTGLTLCTKHHPTEANGGVARMRARRGEGSRRVP